LGDAKFSTYVEAAEAVTGEDVVVYGGSKGLADVPRVDGLDPSDVQYVGVDYLSEDLRWQIEELHNCWRLKER
jgi:hypothetical protein